MLYIEGTDEIGHVFGADVPPRLSCTSDADFARYGRAVDEYYAVVDRMLARGVTPADIVRLSAEDETTNEEEMELAR